MKDLISQPTVSTTRRWPSAKENCLIQGQDLLPDQPTPNDQLTWGPAAPPVAPAQSTPEGPPQLPCSHGLAGSSVETVRLVPLPYPASVQPHPLPQGFIQRTFFNKYLPCTRVSVSERTPGKLSCDKTHALRLHGDTIAHLPNWTQSQQL